MKRNELNKRSGIKFYRIDEARAVPRRREDLHPASEKNLEAKKEKLNKTIGLLQRAVKHLEDMPHTDFMGDVPHWIEELEYILHGDDGKGGMTNIIQSYEKSHRMKVRDRKSQEKYAKELEAMRDKGVTEAAASTCVRLRDLIEAGSSDADREMEHDKWVDRMRTKFKTDHVNIKDMDTYLDSVSDLKRELLRSAGLTPKQTAPFLVAGKAVESWVKKQDGEVYFSKEVAKKLDDMEGAIWAEMNELKGHGTDDEAKVRKWLTSYKTVADTMMKSDIDFDDWLTTKR